jgi:hypothetical protein
MPVSRGLEGCEERGSVGGMDSFLSGRDTYKPCEARGEM